MQRLSIIFIILASYSSLQADPSIYKTQEVWKNSVQDGADIELVAKLPYAPGNIAVTPAGKVIISMAPFGPKSPFQVAELLPNGSLKAFPNKNWQAKPNPQTNIGFDAVQGIVCDSNGILWMLDKGATDPATKERRSTKLVGWDTRSNRLYRIYVIPVPVEGDSSFIQDLAVDTKRNKIYLADMSQKGLTGKVQPAIITIDLSTGHSRRVLTDHISLNPDQTSKLIVDGHTLTLGKGDAAKPLYLALNPISIDPRNHWVYFGPMSSHTLYRIPADTLADSSLTPKQVRFKVEAYGEKPVCGGILAGDDGKIYTSDFSTNAIHYTSSDGKDHALSSHPKLSWTDGYASAPDGKIYSAINQLGRISKLNGGKDRIKPGEFYIIRTKPAGGITIGR